ncbi:hypothetical protein OROGR_002832 [Orobanche gracilis]
MLAYQYFAKGPSGSTSEAASKHLRLHLGLPPTSNSKGLILLVLARRTAPTQLPHLILTSNPTSSRCFENKWSRSSSQPQSGASSQSDNNSQSVNHKCTDPEICKRQIAEDFEQKKPLWILTCYYRGASGSPGSSSTSGVSSSPGSSVMASLLGMAASPFGALN